MDKNVMVIRKIPSGFDAVCKIDTYNVSDIIGLITLLENIVREFKKKVINITKDQYPEIQDESKRLRTEISLNEVMIKVERTLIGLPKEEAYQRIKDIIKAIERVADGG